jgi:RNA polymerase sigma factor (sigma-70 family)
MPPIENWDLTRYREILRRRSNALRIDPRVQVRFDESDLVQETLMRAADPDRPPCAGQTDGERIAWLFAIQERLLLDKYDEQFAQKRDPRREVSVASMQQAFSDSTVEYIPGPESREKGPAEIAQAREELRFLDGFLDQLTPDHREVLLARREGLTVHETAARLGVTTGVVAARIVKATRQLLELSRGLREGRSDD